MKIKEDIIKWQREIKELETLNVDMSNAFKQLSDNIEGLKNQVSLLVKTTEEMTDAMLALIRQQIGD